MAQYDLFGGEPPSQRHSKTSRAAAAAIKQKIGPMHVVVLYYLYGCGGATDEEMQAGIPMSANTQRPRRRELELMGCIVDSGRVRLTNSRRQAVVWIIAPQQPSGRP
jgi:hypothetical protein